MSSPDPIARLPYPLARVCAQLDDDTQSLQTRQEALYFAVYQLLRTLALPLLGQYLLGPKAGEAGKAQADKLNKAIQRLRSPYFSDWIGVLDCLRKVAPKLGLDFLSRFDASMAAVERLRFDLPDADYGLEHGRCWRQLDPWDAFLALRNHTAHSGGRSDDVCRRDIAHFRPLLWQLLAEFDWLGDYTLLALDADPDAWNYDETAAPVRVLRGPEVAPAVAYDLETDAPLAAAFADSPLVLRAPDGRVQALFPLGHGHLEGEPMHWFDGFYLSASDAAALQALAASQGQAGAAGPLPRLQRSVLYYLGCGRRVPLDDEHASARVRVPAPCDAAQRLRVHLDRHAVPWQLRRADLAPWTIRDSVNDYSARTLADLTGSKYFPQVYRERPDFDDALWAFCSAPVADAVPRALWLSGRAGTGKSALLCHLCARLLAQAAQTQDLVFFLRGDGINANLCEAEVQQHRQDDGQKPTANLPGGLLFANFAQKIGLAHNDCKEFSDLFTALDVKRRSDAIEQRKLVIVLDALNEAGEPRARLREVFALLSVLRDVPWVRLIVSVRSEFIDVWRSRREALEANPFHALRDLCLPPPAALVREADRSLPDWPLAEFDESEAAAVYAAYQRHPDLRACRTPWERLAPGSRALLHRPLHLHLWMEAFDQRDAPMPAPSAADALFEAWIDAQCARFDQLEAGLQPLLAHVLAHGRSELDADDDRALREQWERTHTESERRRLDTPVQIAVAAGVFSARTLEEGSGYRFVFQRLGEQLLFRHLRRSAPDYAPVAVARWLACPASELLEGALARLAGELLQQDRARELAAFVVPSGETSARALERALAGSLLQAPERTAVAVSAVLAALGDVEQKLRFCRSLLWFIPDRIEGLGRHDSRLPLYQAAATTLATLAAAEPQRSDLARDLSVSFIKLGDLHGALGHGAEALAFFEQARAIAERLAAAEPQRSDLARDLSVSFIKLGDLHGALGHGAEALAFFEQARAIRERLAAAEPQRSDLARDLSVSYERLGDLHGALGHGAEALAFFEQARAIRERLAAAEPQRSDLARDLSVSFNKLGDLHGALGHGAEALAFFEQARAIAERLAAAEPQRSDLARDLSVSFIKLGDLHGALGHGAEALAFFEQARAIHERLAAAEPQRSDLARDLSVSFIKLGDLHGALGHGAEALAFFEQARAIRERLAAAEPQRSDLARDLSVSFNKLGDLHGALGHGAEALAFFEQARAIRERLAAAEPQRSDLARDLSVSYERLGDLHGALGHGAEALAFFEQARAIAERLAAAEPQRSDLARDLSVSYERLGDLHGALGHGAEALAFFEQARAIAERLAAAEPQRSDLARDLLVSFIKLGDLHGALGHGAEALAFFEPARAIRERLAAAEPQRSDLARDLSVSFNKLGDLHGALGHGAEALAFFEQARAIAERLAAAEPQRSDLAWDLVCSLVRVFQMSGVEPTASAHLQRALCLLSALEAEGRLPGKQAADGLQMLRQMLGAG